MVDRTYYTDGAKLTYQEKDHLISFIIDVENYNINYQTPAHYGQYVSLVHVLTYCNIHGEGMVRIFYYYDIRASFAYILLKLNYIANYNVIIMFFNRKSRMIVCLI